MIAPKELVRLFLTLPPGAAGGLTTAEQDFDNITASGVRLIQTMLDFAEYPVQVPGRNYSQPLLSALRAVGMEHVSLRLREQHYDNKEARKRSGDQLFRYLPFLDVAVLGVEVDERFDSKFGSPNWGEDRARVLNDEIMALYEEWAPLIEAGLRVVTPALMYRGHYRDWREGPQPGIFRWWELMRQSHNEGWANAVHLYGEDGTSYDTLERVRTGLWVHQSLANRPTWLGEVNCNQGTDLQQMLFTVRLLSLLYWQDRRHAAWGQWAGSGERVWGFVPFALNGDTKGWGSPNHLVTNRVAYELLGRFMAGERFYFW